ncbi:hypothetical protein BJV77DRAFT_1067095 [Russula vinacea]|nr:hypothetical protein BJV77DRAFT_1067095 [Russula vinacea]
MGKRARQDPAGPFLSRITTADILRGDIHDQGSYIEGRIHAKNPRNNQYSIDVRPLNVKAKPVYLDVFIAEKLQRRLGELSVGDHLRILLEGAQLYRLPVLLPICKAKKKKQGPNVDNPDVGWFSTPPQSDGTFGTQAATVVGPNLTNSAEPLPQGASSLATQASHSEAENDADPSTLATTPVVLSSSRKSPLTAGESRGARTYAYRTAPSHQLSSPVHPTSTPELSPTAHSTIPRSLCRLHQSNYQAAT